VRSTLFALLCLGIVGGCGGGGGSTPVVTFHLAGSVPAAGQVDADPNGMLYLTFSQPVDATSITAATVTLQRDGGGAGNVPLTFGATGGSPSTVALAPLGALLPNTAYHLRIDRAVRSVGGDLLGSTIEVCFITLNPTPTVRPDQLLDLGDRLHVPRYLARAVRLPDGRTMVFGGHRSATETTDTVEVWNAATRTFDLLPGRLLTPRAEFTATVLSNGTVLLAGGVAEPGGPPLASTEFFHPLTGTSSAGPPLNEARRWQGACRYQGTGAMVSGGFGATGDALDTIEILDGTAWRLASDTLPVPTTQHLQFLEGVDEVYVTPGNLQAMAAHVNGADVHAFIEPDIRFRPEGLRTEDGRVLVVAGDTRSVVIHDMGTRQTWIANSLLFDRRGAFSLTPRGPRLYLAAGGFQISAGGRAITTLEVVQYLPNGGGVPDAAVHFVEGIELPVPFAGHVGFTDDDGSAVLAGGFVDGGGEHSRRVVMILDDASTPPLDCR